LPPSRSESAPPNRRRSSRKRGSKTKRSFFTLRKIKSLFRLVPGVLADKIYANNQVSSSDVFSSALFASFYALTLLFIVSVAFSSFPLRLGQIDWHLRQLSSFAESAPLLVAAFSFALASVSIVSTTRAAAKKLLLMRRIIRPLVIILCVLLPVQVALSARFANRNYNSNRAEAVRLSDQNNKIKNSLLNANSKLNFQDVLLKLGIGVDSQKFDTISLPEAKNQALAVINQQYNQQISQLSMQRRRRLLIDLLNGMRLFASWIAILFFFISYQKFTKTLSIRSQSFSKVHSISQKQAP
jgi:hypothetical protein